MAAKSSNPAATRLALRTWSQILYPSAQNDAYEQLIRHADPALRKELEALDHCLYGRLDVVWEGQEVAACIAAWQLSSSGKAGKKLPELYPND